jgi:hypothetical protein
MPIYQVPDEGQQQSSKKVKTVKSVKMLFPLPNPKNTKTLPIQKAHAHEE